MSSSINVYVVSTARLKQVVGSGDSGLVEAIINDQEDFLSRTDNIDDDTEFACT